MNTKLPKDWAGMATKLQQRARKLDNALEFKHWDEAAQLALAQVKTSVLLLRWIHRKGGRIR